MEREGEAGEDLGEGEEDIVVQDYHSEDEGKPEKELVICSNVDLT